MRKIILSIILSISLFGGTIEEIQNQGKIRVGIKYDTKPFGFKDGKKVIGFDIELSKLIIEEIKVKYNLPKLQIFYKQVVPLDREIQLVENKVDMIIATYTINKKSKEKIDFSNPYFNDDVSIVHRNEFIKVGVLKNSTTITKILNMGYKTHEYLTYDEMFNDFDSKKINAIATNKSILKDYIKENKYFVLESKEVEYFAVGLPKNDIEFKKLIDEILAKLKENGELDKLHKKWFK